MKVIAVTDRRNCARPLMEQIDRVCASGVDMLVLREKDLAAEEYSRLASEAKGICGKHGVELCVNTFADVASDLGVGTAWVPFAAIERGRPGVGRLGVSVHSRAEARRADELGADFVVYGNVFETACKPGAPARGFGELRMICIESDIPVYAIGGICPANMQAVHDCGVDGICMMSAYMLAEDPSAITGRARSLLERSEHVQVPGDPVEDRLLPRPDAQARNRPRLDLGPARVGDDAVGETLPVGDRL